ncbi:hypothetical protein EV426DRAFT_7400 [Tirmania nivea]|nr:hypothetical protein EV426DRAFT_7400 [Tirmania nivea]
MSAPAVLPQSAQFEGGGTTPLAVASSSAHDLRTRTLTFMISALDTTNSKSRAAAFTSLEHNPVVSDPDGTDSNTRWLKLLNQIALLLVREHEIVAVLPKQSGPQAHVNIIVTTDSDSEEDYSLRSKDPQPPPPAKYLVTQNPTSDSPDSPTPTAHHLTLETLKTTDSLLEYLNSHRHVSFLIHVLSVEALLNKCISKPIAGITLLKLYITFRAAPKMNWQFNSPTLTSFYQALQSLTPEEVSRSVYQNNLTISLQTMANH